MDNQDRETNEAPRCVNDLALLNLPVMPSSFAGTILLGEPYLFFTDPDGCEVEVGYEK
jgi:hypothetical protein